MRLRVAVIASMLGGLLIVTSSSAAVARAKVATTTFRAPLVRPTWCDSWGCASWDYYGNVALDAEVEPASTTATLPTGTVAFFADGGPIGSAPVGTNPQHNGSTGAANDVIAHLVATTLAVGSHQITARYSGDRRYQPSTAVAWNVNVHPSPTQSTLASSPNPSEIDEPPTVTVAVTPHWGGVAAGSVALKDGSADVATAALDPRGQAVFHPSLSGGVHHLSATYTPVGGFTGSDTPIVDQTVTLLTTSLQADPVAASPDATMTAHLSFSHPIDTTRAGGPVTGATVRFDVAGVDVCTATTDATGTAVCGPPQAAAAIISGYTAIFDGDQTFAPASGSAPGS